METRLRLLLLSPLLALAGCATLWGNAPEADAPSSPGTAPTAVVSPQVERRQLSVPRIDAQNWEIGPYLGSMSVEDFEVDVVYGGRFAYHINEDFFAEGIVGMSDAGLSSFERVSGTRVLTSSEREFRYYSVGFGWNALPGEVFLGGARAYTSALYLTGGVGGTRFAGQDQFTVTLGAGARVLINDGLAVHFDLRDLIMDRDFAGDEKQTHNFEATVSLTAFF